MAQNNDFFTTGISEENTGNNPVIVNKSYTDTFTIGLTLKKNPVVKICEFQEFTIQANKKVKIEVAIPLRSNNLNWGGGYFNINAKINSNWYNLGNRVHDGGMVQSSRAIETFRHVMILDFIEHLGLPNNQPYTVQIEIEGRSFNGDLHINKSHEINKQISTRGAVMNWAKNQNFTTLHLTELDK